MQTYKVVGQIKSRNAQCHVFYHQKDNLSKQAQEANYQKAKDKIRAQFIAEGFSLNPTFRRYFVRAV